MDCEFKTLPMSEDQFLAWAEGRDGGYELVEGAVIMRAGATRDHERVAKRIFALLYGRVDAASCILTWSSIRRADRARSAPP